MKTFWQKLTDLLMPQNIEDWDVRVAVTLMLKTVCGSLVITLFFVALFFTLGLPHVATLGLSFVLINSVGLGLLKLGHHVLFRGIYFITTAYTAVLMTPMFGGASFLWVYSLSMYGGLFTATVPREKRLRSFGTYSCFSALLLLVVIDWLSVIPSDFSPEAERYMRYFGLFNVSYSVIMRILSASRLQAEILLYKEKLEQQSVNMLQQAKMSTLGEMAGGVAHEINNPLAMILGHSTQLARELVPGVPVNERMVQKNAKIQQTIERISKIVSALRTFSRNADEDPFQNIKIVDIQNEAMNFYGEKLAAAKIEVRLKGDTEIQLECRQTQISQVLVSLINNSQEAIKDLPEKWIEISWQVVDNKMVLAVTDNGGGIPDAVADRLMQPFFTTKELGKGTGLGLSVAKGIIESHHGSLCLDRTCSNTRFVIELPLSQPVGGQKSQRPASAA